MKLACSLADYRVPPRAGADLAQRPTRVKRLYRSKQHYLSLLEEYQKELGTLQNTLYAHNRYALLLIFQGMDAAGKDGAIKHVMSGVNPQGCQVFSFKQPSSEELDHDFLWRTTKRLPERGRIGIFNRSYYEELLIPRVNPEVLARQRVPEEFINPDTLWNERAADIVNLEDFLHRNGTRTLKFFLHLSNEEQRKRLLERIDDRDKNWKLSPADIESREKWGDFQAAYAHAIATTSTLAAPWFVIPADDKRNARLIISHAIIDTFRSLPLHYPKTTEEHRRELQVLRGLLSKPAEKPTGKSAGRSADKSASKSARRSIRKK
jgi:PPK2 family polyphosphate:nucleotide phosphotransferase